MAGGIGRDWRYLWGGGEGGGVRVGREGGVGVVEMAGGNQLQLSPES